MKRAIGWRMAGMAVLMAALMASAVQAQQPTVVLSIRGIEELLDDAEFIGGEVGQEGWKETAEAQINALTGGKGLAGIDQTKPLGLYWDADGGDEMPVVFLPVSDADDLKGLLTDLAPDFKDSKGQWSFTVNGTKISAKIAKGYCFASMSPSALAELPDPAKIANSKYDIVLDVSLASIPDQLKKLFLAQTEENGRRAMEASPEAKNKAEEVGRDFGFDGSLAVLKSVANDGDRLTFGIDVDSESRLAAIDIAFTAQSDTDLSKSMAAYGKTMPLFAGLGAETAPLRLVLTYTTSGMTEQLDKLFDAMRDSASEEIEKDDRLDSDAKRSAAKKVATRIFDIAQATVKSGSVHSGLVLESAEEGKLRVIAGTKVVKGDEAGKLVDDILKLSKESPEVAKVKVDVAKHAGARIHAVTPDVNDDTEKYFGDEPGHLAIRNDSIWVALGGDNLSSLKKALDQFGKTPARSPAPISLRIKPAALVVLMEKDNEDLIERAREIVGKPGDKLNLEIVPVTGGLKLRLEFGIDLIGLAPQGEDN